MNGTITNATGSAYTVGENVSFTFTTSPSLGTPDVVESSTSVKWTDAGGSNPFSNITGSGLTGQWTGTTDISLTGLHIGSFTDYLRVYVNTNTGLFKNGKGISSIDMRAMFQLGTFPSPWPTGNDLTPANLFPSGTYTSFASSHSLDLNTTNDSGLGGRGFYSAELSSVTIGSDLSSVPEPSRALLLIAGLGSLLLRRRRA